MKVMDIMNKLAKSMLTPPHQDDRAEDMQRLRDEGWTLQRIADKHGVSRQRVWQILAKRSDR